MKRLRTLILGPARVPLLMSHCNCPLKGKQFNLETPSPVRPLLVHCPSHKAPSPGTGAPAPSPASPGGSAKVSLLPFLPRPCLTPCLSPTTAPHTLTATLCHQHCSQVPDRPQTGGHRTTIVQHSEIRGQAAGAPRDSPGTPGSFLSDCGRATHPLWVQTQSAVKGRKRISYSSRPFHLAGHCRVCSEAVESRPVYFANSNANFRQNKSI